MKVRKNSLHIILGIVLIFVFFSVAVLNKYIANLPEIYNDITIDMLAQTYSNKSYEIRLFWILLIISMVIIIVANRRNRPIDIQCNEKESDMVYFWLLVTINIVWLLFKGNVSYSLLLLFIGYIIYDLLLPKFVNKLMFLSVLMYYMYIGVIACLNFCFKFQAIEKNSVLLIVVFSMLVIIYLFKKGNESILNKVIIYCQFFIPFVFFGPLNNKYVYSGEVIQVEFDIKYRLILYLLIIIQVGINLYYWKKNQQNINSTESEYIVPSTIISIFAYRSFTLGAGLIASPDLHHNPENIVPWQQVLNFNQELYSEFAPASGLFPIVGGFFNDILNDGTYTAIMSSQNLMRIIFSVVVITLLCFIFDKKIAFILAIVFNLPFYNRVYFLIFSILIILLPKLLKKPKIWLPSWLMACFLGGLYYPVNGVAFLLGSFPLGVFQSIKYFKSGELKKDSKKIWFYIVWLSYLILVIFHVKLLLLMAKHILVFAKQSIVGEGISVFSSGLPQDFMPYINNEGFKMLMVYSLKYFLTILIPIVALYYILYMFKGIKSIFEEELFERNTMFFSYIIILIVSLTSFNFTIIREDAGVLLSRSSYIISILSMVSIGFMLKEGYKKDTIIVSILISLNVVVFSSIAGVNNYIPSSQYYITDDYTYIDVENESRYTQNIGRGFIPTNVFNFSKSVNERYRNINMTEAIMSTHMGQGIYLLNDLKAAATGTTIIAKDYRTQKHLIELAEKQPMVIFDFNSYVNYYIYYHFLVDRGYRQGANGFYMSPETILKYYGDSYVAPDIKLAKFHMNDLGDVPASHGRSINSLLPIFRETYDIYNIVKNISTHSLQQSGKESFLVTGDIPLIVIDFNKKIKGVDADFLYLELDVEKGKDKFSEKDYNFMFRTVKDDEHKVTIFWREKFGEEFQLQSSLKCNLRDGKLLIPLGIDPSWLFGENRSFRIDFNGAFEIGDEIKIKEMKLMKLNQNRE